MRRGSSTSASALVAVALCVATCAARVGFVAADGASWSEDLDGLDEYLLDSPRLTEKFLQEAMREEREKQLARLVVERLSPSRGAYRDYRPEDGAADGTPLPAEELRLVRGTGLGGWIRKEC